MNISLKNVNNQNKKECQPLRNNAGVQPLRGKASKNTSFASSTVATPSDNSNSVSQKDYAALQAKYDVACRIIASQRLNSQNKSLNYLA